MNIIKSGVFFWIMGFVVGQVYYLIDAPYYRQTRINAFCYGLINLVVMMIGAKIMYIVENFNTVLQYGVGFQGFSLYGAIFIQILSAYLCSLIYKKDIKLVASTMIIPMILMLGFYRIDCLISGCCGGININGFVVPTQIIEMTFCFVVAGVAIYFTHSKQLLQGQCFYYFMIVYGIVRFVLEFLRVRTNLFWVISVSHIWSLVSIGVGFMLRYLWTRPKHTNDTVTESV